VSAVATGRSGAIHGRLVAHVSGSVVATILVDPLRVSMDLGATSATAGTKVPATAMVTNRSTVKLLGVAASVERVPKLVVTPQRSRRLGPLPARNARTADWTVCATVAGTYAIVVRASGRDVAGHAFVAYSQPQNLAVSLGKRSCSQLF
jgi:hypothetical protein